MNKLKLTIQLLLIFIPVALHAGNVMMVENDTTQPGEVVEISLLVSNDDAFVSFQADISIPEGFSYVENSAELNTQRANGHSMTAFVTDEGKLRIFSYSMNNVPFQGNSGEVAHYSLQSAENSGLYPLELSNAILGNPSSQNILTSTENGSVMVAGPLEVNLSAETDALCSGDCTELTANAVGGTGSYEVTWTSQPAGFTSSGPTVTVCPQETTTYIAEVSDGSEEVSGQLTIQVYEAPDVDAGADGESCASEEIFLSGSVSGSELYSWQTTGDGTFADNSALETAYIPGPGDAEASQVHLILTAGSGNVCGSVSDTLTYQIDPEIVLQAPDSLEVCANDSIYLADVEASNASELLWTSSGDGSFYDPDILNPVYFPGEEDVENGSVILTVTATGNGACPPANEHIFLEIFPAPEVYAGVDTSICREESYALQSAQSIHCSAVYWLTSGDGTFSDSTIIHPVYNPGQDDMNDGMVKLYLAGMGAGPCQNVIDSLSLNINPPPVLDIGEEQIILDTESCKIDSVDASNYTGLIWTTSGDGTFSQEDILQPVYFPGAEDIQNGWVMVQLEAFGLTGCDDISDAKTIYIVSTNNIVRLHGGDVFPADTIEVALGVTNETPFSGIEGLINIPDNFLFIEQSSYLTDRAGDHVLFDTLTGDGGLAFSAISLTNETFSGNEGDVLRFSLHAPSEPGAYPITIDSLLLRDSLNNNILGATINDSLTVLNTTGVKDRSSEYLQIESIRYASGSLMLEIRSPISGKGDFAVFNIKGSSMNHQQTMVIKGRNQVIIPLEDKERFKIIRITVSNERTTLSKTKKLLTF